MPAKQKPVKRARPNYTVTLNPAGVERLKELSAELDPPQHGLAGLLDTAIAERISTLKKILKK